MVPVVLVLVLSAPPSPESSEPPKPSERQATEAAVKATLIGSASAIDACVARHIYEQPEARGTAEVTARFSLEGTATEVRVDTVLPDARNLRVCLRRLARTWTLPKLQQEGAITVTVAVHAGAKFELQDEEEREKRRAQAETSEPEEERPLGDFTFSPGVFLVPTWQSEGGLPGMAAESPGTGVSDDDADGPSAAESSEP